MASKWKAGFLAGALALSTMSSAYAGPKDGQRRDDDHDRDKTRHVLLISIDGMHAVDYENCVILGTCPNLAELGETGINYTRTSTSRPSGFVHPGLLALVTREELPKTVGGFYDVAWDRRPCASARPSLRAKDSPPEPALQE